MNRRGFTLIELFIIMMIAGIMVLILGSVIMSLNKQNQTISPRKWEHIETDDWRVNRLRMENGWIVEYSGKIVFQYDTAPVSSCVERN
jgi:Tfp pilus assembly protein PilV